MSELNKSCFVILGLLSKADHSGYSLKNRMKKRSDLYGSESNAQIYPILKKLEALKLVTSTEDTQSGARHKKIFSITAHGMNTLLNWLGTDCTVDISREEFLLQLSLGQHLSIEQLEKKITAYKTSVATKLEELNTIVQHICVAHEKKPDQSYLLLTYGHIQYVLEAKIRWCDSILVDLAGNIKV